MKNLDDLKLNSYALGVAKWREGNGFFTPNHLTSEQSRDSMLGKLMLVVTEVSEAAEAVRHSDLNNFVEELADTFIRLMDITASCNIDIETAIKDKMEKNLKRPFRHGKSCSL